MKKSETTSPKASEKKTEKKKPQVVEKATTTGKDDKSKSKSKEKSEIDKQEDKGESNKKEASKGTKAGGKKKVTKDPYENLKKEDLMARIKTYEELIKIEKEERRKAIENKNKEIENKEKVIVSIAGTNRKLVNELEDLKKEVDEKLEKIGLKQIKDSEKEKELKKKQAPLEQLLRIKEKELKNAMNLIEIFKKDKDNLERDLNEKGNIDQFLLVQDKLREEEEKHEKLDQDIKILKKLKDEHDRCVNSKEQFEKEKIQLLNDLKYLKDKNKELKEKMRIEEEKTLKAEKDVIAKKIKNKISLPNINTYNSKKPNTTQNKNVINSTQDLKMYWKMLEKADDSKANHNKNNNKTNNNNSQIPEFSPKVQAQSPKEYKKYLSQERHKFALSLQSKNFRQYLTAESEDKHLLGPEEKEILTKLLPAKHISKLERKFELVDQSKATLERKYCVETKSLQKKISDLERRLDLCALNIKESEQTNKILQYQISEQKNENKILTKKLLELNGSISLVKKSISDKEEENKQLMQQIQDTKKKIEDAINNPQEDAGDNDVEANEEVDNDDDDANEEEEEEDD